MSNANSAVQRSRFLRLDRLARQVGRYGSALFGVAAIGLVWVAILYASSEDRARTERAALQNGSNLARTF